MPQRVNINTKTTMKCIKGWYIDLASVSINLCRVKSILLYMHIRKLLLILLLLFFLTHRSLKYKCHLRMSRFYTFSIVRPIVPINSLLNNQIYV